MYTYEISSHDAREALEKILLLILQKESNRDILSICELFDNKSLKIQAGKLKAEDHLHACAVKKLCAFAEKEVFGNNNKRANFWIVEGIANALDDNNFQFKNGKLISIGDKQKT